MSVKRMKILRWTCVMVLASAVALFAIAVLTTPSERGGQRGNVVYASSYTDAVSTDIMDAMGNIKLKTQVCGHCGGSAYVIESERQLAAVFKFAYEGKYLSNCYLVNFTPAAGYVDMRASSGWDVNFLAIGKSESAPYTGCFDFNGLTVYTDFANNSGLFPYLKNGYVGNLHLVHTGYATLVSNTSDGSIIDNVDAEVTVSGENLLANGTQLNAFIAHTVKNGDANNGVFSCDVRMNASSAVTLKNLGGIVYNHASGVISGCTFVYPTSDVTFGNSIHNGGIAAGTSGIAIERCKVTVPSEGIKTLAFVNNSNYNFGGIVNYVSRAGVRIADCEVNIEIDDCSIKSDHGNWSNRNLGVGGIVGRSGAHVEITGCKVVGTNFYGPAKTGGILGAANTTFAIRNCSVFFSGRFRGGQDTGGIFGGNVGASNAENIIDGCEVVINELWSSRCPGGIAGTIRSGWAKITNCNVYMNTLYSDNDFMGALIGYGGSTANHYFENDHIYIKTYSARAAGTKDESGLNASRSYLTYLVSSVPGITAKNVTYTTDVSGMLSIECGYASNPGTVNGTTSQLTGNDYNSAVAEIAAKLKQNADEVASPPVPDVSAVIDYTYASVQVKLTFKKAVIDAGYKIQDLYLSVAGTGDNHYTQLIYAGSVVGNLGAGLSIGDTNIACSAAGFSFQYAAIPNYLTAIQLKVTLKDASGGLHTYAIDSFGTTELTA